SSNEISSISISSRVVVAVTVIFGNLVVGDHPLDNASWNACCSVGNFISLISCHALCTIAKASLLYSLNE
ncbi:9040_t:CDS:1, partial [Cetraspora pellucida]